MTNEEKELLVAYLIDAGEIDGDSVDIEDQFLDWSHSVLTNWRFYQCSGRPDAPVRGNAPVLEPGAVHCALGGRPGRGGQILPRA